MTLSTRPSAAARLATFGNQWHVYYVTSPQDDVIDPRISHYAQIKQGLDQAERKAKPYVSIDVFKPSKFWDAILSERGVIAIKTSINDKQPMNKNRRTGPTDVLIKNALRQVPQPNRWVQWVVRRLASLEPSSLFQLNKE